MSRLYNMNILVTGIPPKQYDHVAEIIAEEWNCDDQQVEGKTLIVSAQSSLAGGETEEEFAARVAQAIWEEHGFCTVEVQAMCLDQLPVEYHYQEKEEFDAWETKRK